MTFLGFYFKFNKNYSVIQSTIEQEENRDI